MVKWKMSLILKCITKRSVWYIYNNNNTIHITTTTIIATTTTKTFDPVWWIITNVFALKSHDKSKEVETETSELCL